MNDVGARNLQVASNPPPRVGLGNRIRTAAADFWLRFLFFNAQRVPGFARAIKFPFIWFAVTCSRSIRAGTSANARRILGDGAPVDRFMWAVVTNFYHFVCDVGQSLRMSREQLNARIESIEGKEKYLAARELGKGAIAVTAHMGSFEASVAALLDREKRIHVVFKRDTGRFEHIRQSLRQRLGIVEQPIDDGWVVWVRLRDALRADEIVAIQGDRVMPGDKGRRMRFLGGHLLVPMGPVKLAAASGAPILPIFSVRTKENRIRLFIEDPIIVQDDIDAALEKLSAVMARYVAAYPEQWLVLHPAFCEDTDSSEEGAR